jgi:hypothetical protein
MENPGVIGIWRGEVVDVRFLARFALQKPHIFPFTTAKSNEPNPGHLYKLLTVF